MILAVEWKDKLCELRISNAMAELERGEVGKHCQRQITWRHSLAI